MYSAVYAKHKMFMLLLPNRYYSNNTSQLVCDLRKMVINNAFIALPATLP